MTIFELSPLALAKAKELMTQNPAYSGQALRLYVEGKGCDGFTYGVSFDEASPDDTVFDLDGLSCIIDSRTLLFCKSCMIDWVDDERGQGFLVDNPNQRHFRGKFYKKSAWQARLNQLQPNNA